LKIEPFDRQPEIAGPGQKISIFLSLLDVHFTRSPLAAEIVKVDYQRENFFPLTGRKPVARMNQILCC